MTTVYEHLVAQPSVNVEIHNWDAYVDNSYNKIKAYLDEKGIYYAASEVMIGAHYSRNAEVHLHDTPRKFYHKVVSKGLREMRKKWGLLMSIRGKNRFIWGTGYVNSYEIKIAWPAEQMDVKVLKCRTTQ